MAGACFPRSTWRPRAWKPTSPTCDPQGRRRGELPDHPALLRQPRLLRLPRAARAAGIEVPIVLGSSRSSATRRFGAPASSATPRSRPPWRAPSAPSTATSGRSTSSGSRTAPSSARSCSPGSARNPLLRPQLHAATRDPDGASRAPWDSGPDAPERRREHPGAESSGALTRLLCDAGLSAPRGRRISYDVHGEGERPIVLVHGS